MKDWLCFLFLTGCILLFQLPDNYTPPTPITAPVMGFPVEGPHPHDHAQVPPGAPQEPSVQVGVGQVAVMGFLAPQKHFSTPLHLCPCCCSASPAAAGRAGGAERNPCWTRRPQIHLWQPGAALPARRGRPSKCQMGFFGCGVYLLFAINLAWILAEGLGSVVYISDYNK